MEDAFGCHGPSAWVVLSCLEATLRNPKWRLRPARYTLRGQAFWPRRRLTAGCVFASPTRTGVAIPPPARPNSTRMPAGPQEGEITTAP